MTLSLTNEGFNYVSWYNGAYANFDSLPSLEQTNANSIATTIQYGIDPQNDTVYADPTIPLAVPRANNRAGPPEVWARA